MTLLGEVEKIGEEIVHGVEAPFKFIAKAEKVFGAALKDEPELKTAIVGLVKQIETVTGDGAKDIATDGLNLPADVQTITDIEGLFEYFKTIFLPVVEAAWKDFDQAVQATPVEVPVTSTAVQTGPGLHTVTAA